MATLNTRPSVLHIHNEDSELAVLDGIIKIGVDRKNFRIKTVNYKSGQKYFEISAVKDASIVNFIYDQRHSLPKSWGVSLNNPDIQEDAVVVTISTTDTSTNHQTAGQAFLKSMKGKLNYDILLALNVNNTSSTDYIYLNQNTTSIDQCLQPVLKVNIGPQNPSSKGVSLVVDDLNKLCEAIGAQWSGYCIFLTATATNLDVDPNSTIILTSTKTVNLPTKN